jgi:hypothetical protein
MPTFEELLDSAVPQDVASTVNLIVDFLNIPLSLINRELKNILCQPECMIFPTIDDMHRAALRILIAKYKLRILNQKKPVMEFYVIDKTSIRTREIERGVMEADPGSLQKTKKREKKRVEKITAGKIVRETKPIIIKQNITGEVERVSIPTARVYGLFAKFGLLINEELENIFGESLRTCISELILEEDACRILEYIEKGKCYKIRCNAWFVDGHYRLTLKKFELPDPMDTVLPSINDLILRFASPIDIDKITEQEVGKFKTVQGIVKNSKTSVNKHGNTQGNMTLISTNYKSRSYLNLVFWNAPEYAIRYSSGSEVYVVCDLQKTEQYGISGIGHFVVPVIKTNRILTAPLVEVSDWW